MDKTQFWQLIEASRADLSGDDICDEQADNLKALLMKSSADEIAQFNGIFDAIRLRRLIAGICGAPLTLLTAALPTTASLTFGGG